MPSESVRARPSARGEREEISAAVDTLRVMAVEAWLAAAKIYRREDGGRRLSET